MKLWCLESLALLWKKSDTTVAVSLNLKASFAQDQGLHYTFRPFNWICISQAQME